KVRRRTKCQDFRNSGCSCCINRHAEVHEKTGRKEPRPLTVSVTPATITSNETQQRVGFTRLPSDESRTESVRRDSYLVPPGEGDLHPRASLPSPASVRRVGISSPGLAPLISKKDRRRC